MKKHRKLLTLGDPRLGEMCEEDKKANNWSLNHDERILASYSDKENDYKIWIITEADRSITTILFPDEY